MIKKFIFLILISLLLFSCKEEEEYNPNTNKDGTYFIETLSSNNEVDINRDSVSNTDLSKEIINLIGFSYLVLDTKILQEKQFVQIWLPKQTIDSSYENGFYWSGNETIEAPYTLEGKELIVDSEDVFSAIFLNDSTISIDFQKEFYTSQGSEILKLNAICLRKNR